MNICTCNISKLVVLYLIFFWFALPCSIDYSIRFICGHMKSLDSFFFFFFFEEFVMISELLYIYFSELVRMYEGTMVMSIEKKKTVG